MKQNSIELLAPAGDHECFMAAVEAGADAVYLGLKKFGARAGALNFTGEELLDVLDVAHIHGRKIYLTVNTLFKDSEMDELYDMLYRPYLNGLDGVIVQDIGVMSAIHDMFPDLALHVSTQAGITASSGARFLAELNVKRIVPARELSLREIRKLYDETHLEIECFIHGSMCYSYSGKCLLSSFIGRRSGNRGRCAQPCRLVYDHAYPLSLKDMCTIDMIGELADAHVASFKIEGRMKSSAYVHGVTSIYRKYLDIFNATGRCDVSPEDRSKLISIYTRSGNCTGYYRQHNSKEMITPSSPSYESSTQEKYIAGIPGRSVNISCAIRSGEKAFIRVYDDFNSTEARVDIIPEVAQNQALTEEAVAKQLKKCASGGFRAKNIEVSVDDGLFLTKGQLNEIRRKGLEAFSDELLKEHRRDNCSINDTYRVYDGTFSECGSHRNAGVDTNVSVLNRVQLDAAVKCDIDGIIIPMSLFDDSISEILSVIGNIRIYISLPYIVRDEDKGNSTRSISEFVDEITKKYDIAGIYVSNAESVQILRQCGYSGKIIADFMLYAYNRTAYGYLKDNGIDATCVPVELNKHELCARGVFGEELMIYGRIPVMISANCICKTQKTCRPLPEGHGMYLTDRKGERLFVYCNCKECTNVIYNSMVLSLSDEAELFDLIRPSSVRLSFTDENALMMRRIINRYLSDKKDNGSTDLRLADEKFTRGHIKRGVE